MSTLYLVRHGQASFGQDDYDRLSEIGEDQSRLLGEFWAKQGLHLDAVYSGTHKRQLDTAEFVRKGYRAAGQDFPETVINADFNEYDAQSIITRSMPTVLKENPELLEIIASMSQDNDIGQPTGKKNFQKIFSRMMEYWVAGKLNIKGIESWKEFTGRVNHGLELLTNEQGSGKTVALFSSGGPVSVAIQRALNTADQTTLDLGWVTRNTSISEFRFSTKGFALYSYNETPHLNQPEMVTYR